MNKDTPTTSGKPFTFYWRDGKREVLYGADAASALDNAGLCLDELSAILGGNRND